MNLITVLSDTLGLWEKEYYQSEGQMKPLKLSMQETVEAEVFLPDQIGHLLHKTDCKPVSQEKSCTIRCRKIDTFSCACHKYMELANENGSVQNKDTAVLNFANPVHPGGGVRYGARAQEEDLCRRSSLLLSLESEAAESYYRFNQQCDRLLSSDALIISPKVEVVKDKYYKPLPESIIVSVITCAAPIFCLDFMAEEENAVLRQEQHYKLFYQRIQIMLLVSAYYGFRNLILGAWGCGAFGNDAEIVAELFQAALESKDTTGYSMKDYFQSIDFAVPGLSNPYNHEQFYKKFGSLDENR